LLLLKLNIIVMTHTPFTYYLCWTALDLHYYGVRYAINCDPSDLWTRYFTSSTYVNRLRKNYGDPDIIQIRRTFSSEDKAKQWEVKVLSRVKALDRMNWLNCGNQSIRVRKNFDGYLAPNYGHIFSLVEKVNKSIQNKKSKWWNNGTDQRFCEIPPDSSYQRGRLTFNNRGAQMGADISKLKRWYTDGTESVFVIPGTEPAGYVTGRKIKTRAKPSAYKGSQWWTNGQKSKLSFVSPGPDWQLGRIIKPSGLVPSAD
jgi:hypothetical protein